jgi:hypothetical protein
VLPLPPPLNYSEAGTLDLPGEVNYFCLSPLDHS